jgi:hypothetical protein
MPIPSDINSREWESYKESPVESGKPARRVSVQEIVDAAKKRLSLATTHQNNASAVGNGVAAVVEGYSNGILQISGTFVGTITFEGTVDGTNWIAIALADLNSTTRARAISATVPGLFLLDYIGGLKQFRARISAYTSGGITAQSIFIS